MYIYKPIPKLTNADDCSNVAIADNMEKLVSINESTLSNRIKLILNNDLTVNESSNKSAYIREGIIERLEMASIFLPAGYSLIIFGAWKNINNLDASSKSSSGGSLDITIEDSEGNLLDMGSNIYDKTDKSTTRYYEALMPKGIMLTAEENIYINNRRMLFNILTRSGFVNYENNWWRYDYGTKYWGKVKSKDAIYEDVELD